jgi:hypothetical protein
MASKKSSETPRKQMRVIVESHLSLVVSRANELGITPDEYKDIKQTGSDFVLIYFR